MTTYIPHALNALSAATFATGEVFGMNKALTAGVAFTSMFGEKKFIANITRPTLAYMEKHGYSRAARNVTDIALSTLKNATLLFSSMLVASYFLPVIAFTPMKALATAAMTITLRVIAFQIQKAFFKPNVANQNDKSIKVTSPKNSKIDIFLLVKSGKALHYSDLNGDLIPLLREASTTGRAPEDNDYLFCAKTQKAFTIEDNASNITSCKLRDGTLLQDTKSNYYLQEGKKLIPLKRDKKDEGKKLAPGDLFTSENGSYFGLIEGGDIRQAIDPKAFQKLWRAPSSGKIEALPNSIDTQNKEPLILNRDMTGLHFFTKKGAKVHLLQAPEDIGRDPMVGDVLMTSKGRFYGLTENRELISITKEGISDFKEQYGVFK